MTAGRWLLMLMGVITLVGLILRVYGIAGQPLLTDEMSVAFSAVNYVENGQFGPTMWYHPNLRNIVVYLMGEGLGYGLFTMRGVSLLTGIMSIPLAGLVLYRLTENRRAAVITSLLLAVEQVHITFSRQAIQEVWTTFFFLAGVFMTLVYRDKERPWQLVAAGIAFGLGMACKFHALFPLVVCLLFCLHSAWRRRSFSQGAFVVGTLVFIPLTVYLLTYIPWFGRGYGLADWVAMQKALFAYTASHQGNPMDQTIDRAAWQWFLRPLGYANFVFAGGRPYLTVASSNPLVWLCVIPAALFQLRLAVRQRRDEGEDGRGRVFLQALFLASYAPLAVSIRPIWLLSALAVIPFAFMVLALTLEQLSARSVWGKRLVAVYLLAATAGSLYLYPLAIGKGMFFPYLAPIAEKFRQNLDPVAH
ncbi:MAG TPA: phospholipid carrier-dependent glycosyltransferase [Geobacteraceae bacterium]